MLAFNKNVVKGLKIHPITGTIEKNIKNSVSKIFNSKD